MWALLSASANATVVYTTYAGTVAKGAIDSLGLFGPADASLGGDGFTAVFVTNDATPGASILNNPAAASSLIYGAGASSPVTGLITINDTRVPISGNVFSNTVVYSFTYESLLFSDSTQSVVGGGNESLSIYVGSLSDFFTPPTGDYHTPFSHFFETDDFIQAEFIVNPACEVEGTCYLALENIQLRPTFVAESLSPYSAAPEPGVWSVLIMGLLVVGGVLRRVRGRIRLSRSEPGFEVVATALPEPAAWLLLLSWTALCGGVLRFRRGRTATGARGLGFLGRAVSI